MQNISSDTLSVNQTLHPDTAITAGFLGWWFAGCTSGVVELGWKPKDGNLNQFCQFPLGDWYALAEAAAHVNRNGADVYVRAATMHAHIGGCSDSHFVQAPGIWLDADDAEQVRQATESSINLVPPSAVVVTGTVPEPRVHLWFKLDAPTGDAELVETLNKRAAKKYGTDSATTNTSRLMRLPGCVSWPHNKPKKEGRIPELVIWKDKHREPYSVEWLAGLLPQVEPETKSQDRATSTQGQKARDLLELSSALYAIPNSAPTKKGDGDAWKAWNDIGMGMYAATDGSAAGFELWDSWCQRHPTYDAKATADRWKAYTASPPDRIGAGTIIRLAREAGWQRAKTPAEDEFPAEPLPEKSALLNRLGVRAWIKREIAPPDRLLGDLLTTTSRMFLIGRTGLGKTNLAVAIATALSAGMDFLHWHCARPVRVLYIDGEMPPDLIRERVIEAERRLGREVPDGNLVIYSAVDGEDFATVFPAIGIMPPLNTVPGHDWLKRLIQAFGGFDVVILDNVMSLLSGDQKDELAWSETLPLVQWLTAQRIGQLWLDHTGHDASRQYGSSTKAWRMDAAGIMAPPEGQDGAADGDLSFKLSFDHPGKARRRTPRNWQDFADRVIRLSGDRWTSEPVQAVREAKADAKRLTKDEAGWLEAIRSVFIKEAAGRVVDIGQHITLDRDAIRDALKDQGLFDLNDKGHIAGKARMAFLRTLAALAEKKAIGIDGQEIWLA